MVLSLSDQENGYPSLADAFTKVGLASGYSVPHLLSYINESWEPESKRLEWLFFCGIHVSLALFYVQQLIKVCREMRAADVDHTKEVHVSRIVTKEKQKASSARRLNQSHSQPTGVSQSVREQLLSL